MTTPHSLDLGPGETLINVETRDGTALRIDVTDDGKGFALHLKDESSAETTVAEVDFYDDFVEASTAMRRSIHDHGGIHGMPRITEYRPDQRIFCTEKGSSRTLMFRGSHDASDTFFVQYWKSIPSLEGIADTQSHRVETASFKSDEFLLALNKYDELTDLMENGQ